MNILASLEERGLIKITSTFALAADLELDHTKLGDARRARAAHLPQARSGFIIGRSTVGGPDVIGGPDVYAHVDAIAEAVRPGVPWEKLDRNTQRDVLHLAAHRTYRWELFLTKDKGILNRASNLAKLEILVMTPANAIVHLARSGIA